MNKKLLKEIKSYTIIIGCALLLALNYAIFIINNKFAPSGINGIATMLQYKFGFSIGYFSLIINIPLCIAAFLLVNKEFAIKSFAFTASYSLFYIILTSLDLSSFAYYSEGIDVIIPVFTAALISGFIYGTVFKLNASTGGTDIIAKLISRKRPDFNFVWVIFGINCVVAAISYFVYGEIDSTGKIIFNLKPVLLCIFYSFVSSRIGNSLLHGVNSGVKVEIITTNGKELAQELIEDLKHSVTMSDCVGMFKHENKNLLTCIINKHQLNELMSIVDKYPDAFAYVTSVTSVIGNFKRIKREKKI